MFEICFCKNKKFWFVKCFLLYFCTVVFLRSGCFFSKTNNRHNLLIINLIQKKF